MNIQFILKLYCILAGVGAVALLIAGCNDALSIYCVLVVLFLVLLYSILKPPPPAQFSKDSDGSWSATVKKGDETFFISKDGAFINIAGQWLPSPQTPCIETSRKVMDMNSGVTNISPAITFTLLLALAVMAPAIFPETLATAEYVYVSAKIAGFMTFILLALGVLSVLALAIHYFGGITLSLETDPLKLDVKLLDTPEMFDVSPALVLIPEKKETPRQYADRVALARESNTDTLFVIPPGNGIWLAEDTGGQMVLNRTVGSETLGIDPIAHPMAETGIEYRRSAFEFVCAIFRQKGTTQKQIANDLKSDDVLSNVIDRMKATCIAVLLFACSLTAQNNEGKLVEYLGTDMAQLKPSGLVSFNFKKLTINVQGDGQKTFKNLLLHSTGFDNAGAWGPLNSITVSDMPIARARQVAASVPPLTGESIKNIPESITGEGVMDDLKVYYSTEATQKRIADREAASREFSEKYSENIRRDWLSISGNFFGAMFWIITLIGGAFYLASYVASKESAIFQNGAPIFGRIQNWVHSWSAGVLFLIALVYSVIWLIYSSLMWIVPIGTYLISIPLFVANIAFVGWAAQKVIPNKRVLISGNRGGNITGQHPNQFLNQ